MCAYCTVLFVVMYEKSILTKNIYTSAPKECISVQMQGIHILYCT